METRARETCAMAAASAYTLRATPAMSADLRWEHATSMSAAMA
jgi:hypothetical protein